MSGDEISVYMKIFEKLSSVAYGLKNNVYSGTPCITKIYIFNHFKNKCAKLLAAQHQATVFEEEY